MKVIKILLSIVLWIVMISLSLVGIFFLFNGGGLLFGEIIEDRGFFGFLVWFFQEMANGIKTTFGW